MTQRQGDPWFRSPAYVIRRCKTCRRPYLETETGSAVHAILKGHRPEPGKGPPEPEPRSESRPDLTSHVEHKDDADPDRWWDK